MKDLRTKNKVIVPSDDDGMRLDNYLIKIIKGMPKSRIYRMIRKGEVRINSKRAKPSSRVHINDKIRIPPNTLNQPKTNFSSCLLYTSPSPRDKRQSRMPSSA